jgi:hypothetical protein
MKMKTLNTMMAALVLTAVPMVHAEEKKAGPNGGRVISSVEPHYEFFVMPDRKLKLTFLGEDGKAIAVAEQSATGVGGDRSKPTRFKFEKVGDVLVSDMALPEGMKVPLILQVKVKPDAKTVTEKFTVDFSSCPGCVHLEYACTCDH